jgi:hypothetical protein
VSTNNNRDRLWRSNVSFRARDSNASSLLETKIFQSAGASTTSGRHRNTGRWRPEGLIHNSQRGYSSVVARGCSIAKFGNLRFAIGATAAGRGSRRNAIPAGFSTTADKGLRGFGGRFYPVQAAEAHFHDVDIEGERWSRSDGSG